MLRSHSAVLTHAMKLVYFKKKLLMGLIRRMFKIVYVNQNLQQCEAWGKLDIARLLGLGK